MAPELLLHGRASSASDVYAYGILLWELLTARRAFQGVPVALLAQNVVQQRWRPGWPPGVPAPLRLLTEQCWAQEAAARCVVFRISLVLCCLGE
jgi:serine/threonine protein kinase